MIGKYTIFNNEKYESRILEMFVFKIHFLFSEGQYSDRESIFSRITHEKTRLSYCEGKNGYFYLKNNNLDYWKCIFLKKYSPNFFKEK